MENVSIFTPLQKALKSRTDSPIEATLSLVSAVGEFAAAVKTHYSKNPVDLVPSLSKVLESTCIIANGAGYEIQDVKTSVQFHGADQKSMTLRVATQELIAHAARLLQNPREGSTALTQIHSSIMSLCVSHNIEFKAVVDYALLKIQRVKLKKV